MLAQAGRAALTSPLRLHTPQLVRAGPTQKCIVLRRTYAKYSKPPYGQRPSEQTSSATGAARQTSPGTSYPKDQTWKPTDSIKFGAGAATPSQAQPTGDTRVPPSSRETAEFNEQPDASTNTAPTEQPGPSAGAGNPSNPTPGETRHSEGANEEFRGSQDAEVNTEPDSEGKTPGPLPDLRQGIPSTFAKEFGLGQDARSPESSGADEPRGPTPRRRGSAEEEEYSQEDYETSTDRARAKLARIMYAILAAGVVSGSAYFGRPYSAGEALPRDLDRDSVSGWSPVAVWGRIKSRMSGSVEYYTEPTSSKLLPEMPAAQRMPYTLVFSLEDLLVHSEWTREHGWRTAKRPGVDYFLRYLSQYFELVLFTSVPAAMGDMVVRKLDPFHIIMWPLFREATKYENGKYIKDLDYLNRPLEKTIIIDTSKDHVSNQPENAIVLPKWKGDARDPNANDLVALIPFLEYVACSGVPDVRKVMESFKDKNIPQEFARRESLARDEFNRQHANKSGSTGSSRSKVGSWLSSALGMKPVPQPGSMVMGGADPNDQTTLSEGLAKGKMLSDQIRERGQREYARLEEQIRENGEKWLKEMEEEEKKAMESSMKEMKKGWLGSLGAKAGPPPPAAGEAGKTT